MHYIKHNQEIVRYLMNLANRWITKGFSYSLIQDIQSTVCYLHNRLGVDEITVVWMANHRKPLLKNSQICTSGLQEKQALNGPVSVGQLSLALRGMRKYYMKKCIVLRMRSTNSHVARILEAVYIRCSLEYLSNNVLYSQANKQKQKHYKMVTTNK